MTELDAWLRLEETKTTIVTFVLGSGVTTLLWCLALIVRNVFFSPINPDKDLNEIERNIWKQIQRAETWRFSCDCLKNNEDLKDTIRIRSTYDIHPVWPNTDRAIYEVRTNPHNYNWEDVFTHTDFFSSRRTRKWLNTEALKVFKLRQVARNEADEGVLKSHLSNNQ